LFTDDELQAIYIYLRSFQSWNNTPRKEIGESNAQENPFAVHGRRIPARSQTVYHAVGYAMKESTPNTIIMVSPNGPYVSIGYHQDIQKEVDLDYCAQHNLPVYRREVGGGAVFLDNGQLFTQWIFHKEDLPPLWKNASSCILIRSWRPIRNWAFPPTCADQRHPCQWEEDRRHRRGADGHCGNSRRQFDVHLR